VEGDPQAERIKERISKIPGKFRGVDKVSIPDFYVNATR